MHNCIFFLHFHKAGGTSINNFFHKYKKFSPNLNGEPMNDDRTCIPFWTYHRKEFNKFKSNLLKSEIKFIAFEWNYFEFYKEIDFKNIELITCIRDPYERFISNMAFTSYKLQKNYKDHDEFNKEIFKKEGKYLLNFNKYNYYTKILNGFGNKPNKEINKNHLEIAKNNLSKFSVIIILDNKDTFKLLQRYRSKISLNHKNKNKNIKNYSIDFKEFKKKNQYDYELYEYAVKLSNKQLENYNKHLEWYEKRKKKIALKKKRQLILTEIEKQV
tara:strand:- start:108 stop:923 length:816 start_codon:yes stop_codon:yes gene_type:complete